MTLITVLSLLPVVPTATRTRHLRSSGHHRITLTALPILKTLLLTPLLTPSLTSPEPEYLKDVTAGQSMWLDDISTEMGGSFSKKGMIDWVLRVVRVERVV